MTEIGSGLLRCRWNLSDPSRPRLAVAATPKAVSYRREVSLVGADVTVPSMATLLHLDSSADLTGSVSRRLTARFATGWAALGHATVRRDLFLDQPPHLPSSVLHWAPSAASDRRIGASSA